MIAMGNYMACVASPEEPRQWCEGFERELQVEDELHAMLWEVGDGVIGTMGALQQRPA